jgi:hypothetical protein
VEDEVSADVGFALGRLVDSTESEPEEFAVKRKPASARVSHRVKAAARLSPNAAPQSSLNLAATPSQEIQKLGYFVGKWRTAGTILPGPWGAGGKFSWNETTEWMTGNFFVIGHWDFTMPRDLGGNGEEIFVMGYDARQNHYTFDAFSSQGLHQVSKGTLTGDTWTWRSEAFSGGRTVQQKMTMKIASAKSYQLKFELSTNGTNWTTFMEGEAKRK